jgi:hypothetical protein
VAEYGFEEGKDFAREKRRITGGRPSVNYGLIIDTAEISMIQRLLKKRQKQELILLNAKNSQRSTGNVARQLWQMLNSSRY